MWVLWLKSHPECSLDLFDALGLFIFGEDKWCLLPVERRILLEAAIWAAYLIHLFQFSSPDDTTLMVV